LYIGLNLNNKIIYKGDNIMDNITDKINELRGFMKSNFEESEDF
jgi:hypothetical protein